MYLWIYNQWGIISDSNNLSPGPVNTGYKLFRDTGTKKYAENAYNKNQTTL